MSEGEKNEPGGFQKKKRAGGDAPTSSVNLRSERHQPCLAKASGIPIKSFFSTAGEGKGGSEQKMEEREINKRRKG